MDLSFIKTDKTVSQTLSDLRKIFGRYNVDDWEPIPIDGGSGYSVRYFRNRNWTEIKSTFQPTKAMNLRVCFQVIDNMFRWETRGVSGLVKGTSFMGADIVTTSNNNRAESFDEACATLGVEPDSSMDEIERIYKVKVQYAHPDKFIEPTEKQAAAARFKRIQKALEIITKVKGARP